MFGLTPSPQTRSLVGAAVPPPPNLLTYFGGRPMPQDLYDIVTREDYTRLYGDDYTPDYDDVDGIDAIE